MLATAVDGITENDTFFLKHIQVFAGPSTDCHSHLPVKAGHCVMKVEMIMETTMI
jgi:hypothetical protein